MEDTHGGDVAAYKLRYPEREVLDFSANLNPLGMPEGVRRALAGCADGCEHYPDPYCRELVTALARFEQVPEDWILCGNGASDIIYRIAYAIGPKTAVIPAPTFSEYARAMERIGCEVRYHTLLPENSFVVGMDFAKAIDGAEIVFLCNPNNPTGALIAPDVLDAALRECARVGAVLVVDECFLRLTDDYAGYSIKRRLGEYGGLIVLGAFTKLFAMPGLRLGYALCSDSGLLARLDRAGPPWSVSVPAQVCGAVAAEQEAYLAETAKLLPVWRAELMSGLSALGLEVYPAGANYVFFRGVQGLAEELAPHGILLRDCAGFPGLEAGYYRTAVRLPEQNAELLRVLGLTLT